MKNIKAVLILAFAFLAVDATAQSSTGEPSSKNSFMLKIDSLEIDIYQNYSSTIPPINLNNLPESTLFFLNGKKLGISKFSELNIGDEKLQSVSIIQDAQELKQLGHSKHKALVKITTSEKE